MEDRKGTENEDFEFSRAGAIGRVWHFMISLMDVMNEFPIAIHLCAVVTLLYYQHWQLPQNNVIFEYFCLWAMFRRWFLAVVSGMPA